MDTWISIPESSRLPTSDLNDVIAERVLQLRRAYIPTSPKSQTKELHISTSQKVLHLNISKDPASQKVLCLKRSCVCNGPTSQIVLRLKWSCMYVSNDATSAVPHCVVVWFVFVHTGMDSMPSVLSTSVFSKLRGTVQMGKCCPNPLHSSPVLLIV